MGGTTALCHRGLQLDDGGTYSLSDLQVHLLWAWEDFWNNQVFPLLNRRTELYILFMADSVDGDHHGTSQLITKNIYTQTQIIANLLEEPAKRATGMIFLRGTPAHVGGVAEADEQLAANFDNTIPDEHSYSWWHFIGEFNGVKFDAAHTTNSGGKIERNRYAAALRLAYDTAAQHIKRGERPPDYVVRGHIHRFMDSGRNYDTRAVTCPCFQYSTAYGRIRYVGNEVDIGGLVFQISADGQDHGFQEFIYKPKRKQVWKNARD